MNIIISNLKKIKGDENLHLLIFEDIKVLILQLNLPLEIGKRAKLFIKPTKLFLSSEKFEFENRLKVKVKNIKLGKILASVICEYKNFEIEVLILKENINFEKEAFLYFKSSDVSVLEVVND